MAVFLRSLQKKCRVTESILNVLLGDFMLLQFNFLYLFILLIKGI